jgi:hypothetical protein
MMENALGYVYKLMTSQCCCYSDDVMLLHFIGSSQR